MAIPGFIETTWLPDEFTFWAVGGRGWKTTIVETYGGDEFRNQAWSRTKGAWGMQEALRSTNPLSSYYLGLVTRFHRIGRGMLGGFRFRDWADYRNDDADGTGVVVAGQLYKRYTLDGTWIYDQIIVKPRVAYGSYPGVVLNAGGSLDYTTGVVTGGSSTTWTGYYDVPCRFEGDLPDIGMLSDGTYYNWNDCRVVELKNLT